MKLEYKNRATKHAWAFSFRYSARMEERGFPAALKSCKDANTGSKASIKLKPTSNVFNCGNAVNIFGGRCEMWFLLTNNVFYVQKNKEDCNKGEVKIPKFYMKRPQGS